MKLGFKNIDLNQNNIIRDLTETRKIILFGSLIMLLNLIVILPTSALSYQSNEPLSFTFAPTVQITISDNLTIPSLSPGDGKDSNIITVTAASNSATGYVLSSTVGSSTGNASTELRRNGTDTTYKFTNLASSKSSLSDFDTNSNTWGYAYCTSSNDCTSTTNWISGDITITDPTSPLYPTTGYNGLPLYTTESPIKLINSTDASTSSIQFKIGARATTTQVAGEYTNVVNFIGLANPNPIRSFDDLFYAAGKTKYHGYYTMQDMNATICSNAEQGSITQLIDIRDGEVYRISKLKDNRCWLLDNLRLDPTDSVTASNMNYTNTNAPAEAINNYLNPTGTAPQTGWSKVAVADVDTGFSSYTDPIINNASVDTLVTSYGPAASNGKARVGIYYNYCAATMGTYCYAYNAGVGDTSYDICPTNWRMPTGGVSGEYQALCNSVYGGECTGPTYMTDTSPDSLQYILSTPLSGLYGGSQAGDWNGSGRFWSSTHASSGSMHFLFVYSHSVYPQYAVSRNYGYSVRCIANNT